MKFKGVIFPHPVLGIGGEEDFSGICELIDLAIEIETEDYLITFSINHNNNTILNLVAETKAIYCCEVKCGGTFFRELIPCSNNKFSFKISRTKLRGRVDLDVFCLAKTTIKGYNNPSAHKDYSEYSFDLNKADLLAYFGHFTFNADIQYNKLKAASSFMEIIPHEGDQELTEYSFDTHKIQIRLPRSTFDKFKQDNIGKRLDYAPIIHASMVQTALTAALFNYEKSLEGGCLWAESIKHRLIAEQELNNGSEIIDLDQIPSLAQKLLGNPNNRMIDCLEKISVLNEISE
jgi:hypothetical protein